METQKDLAIIIMTTSIDIDVNTKNNTSLSPIDAAVTKDTSAAPVSSQDHSENHAKSHADKTGNRYIMRLLIMHLKS